MSLDIVQKLSDLNLDVVDLSREKESIDLIYKNDIFIVNHNDRKNGNNYA